jgi:chromate transporter
MNGPAKPGRAYLKEAALLFLWIGATAFGGPAVYIAIMQREAVKKRRWLDDQKFLDMLGASNLIPGPNATEMALYLGLVRAGWPGYVVSGLLFVIPGMLFTLVLAWVYVTYASLPQVGWVLYGIKPVVIAIILRALWDLGRAGVKDVITGIVGAAVIALYFLGYNEIALLFAGAAVVLLFHAVRRLIKGGASALSILPLLGLALPALSAAIEYISRWRLFLNFLKIGVVFYGGAYVLLALFNSELVERLGWINHQQLIDAIAAGQVTPGPISTAATFIGYLLGGWPSALLATLAFFIPSFILVAVISRFIPLLRKKWWTGAFLDGVNVAAVGLMVAVTWTIGRAGVVDWFTIALAVIAVVLVFRFRVNSALLVLGGAAAGVVYKLLAG